MEHSDFLINILILLSASVFVVAVFKKLNLSPVLGYFAAGAIIGSYGLNIVSPKDTEVFGEFGVIFLLFAIGLELTFDRLKAMRRYVFGFGTLQVLITALVLGLVVNILVKDIETSLIIGGGLALSSTAIVLQVIAETRQQSTQVGRLSLATLLMQDFAVVPLLVLIPLLSGDKTHILNALGIACLKALCALVGIFILGRVLIRPLFGMITSANTAKTNELFISATLLIALAAAWGTESLGLSHALGAFVAGLLMAETEFQLQAEESISPFKGLFLGLFFMTVGMSINLTLILEKISTIALLSFSLIFIKAFIIFILCLIFRFALSTSIHTGLMLAQGGEFAFILFNLAMDKQLIDKDTGQMLLLVVTISMAFTPLLALLGSSVAKFLNNKSKSVTNIDKEIADLENHVIIIGFGRVGKMVARLLEAENIHYIATDIELNNVEEGKREGFPVYAGDGSDLKLLKSFAIERARSVIITVENEITLKKTAKLIAQHYKELPIVVRSKDLTNSESLYQAGAKIIVPETYETGLQLGGAVLKSIGISEFEVSRIKNQFRAGDYILAKDQIEENSENNNDNNHNYITKLVVNEDKKN